MEVEVPAPSLPTVEQAREFLRLVNVGRVAGGLEPLELLDFDGAEPEAPCGCLSATNLVCALDDFASSDFETAAVVRRSPLPWVRWAPTWR
jgi:hypothetical protein